MSPQSKWSETALHGKGRTKLRPAQVARGKEPPKRIAQAPHTDSVHGLEEGDSPPRFSALVIGEWLPKIELSTAKRELHTLECFHHGRPVALQGTPLVAGLINSWSLEYLGRCSNRAKLWTVLSSSGQLNRFYNGDEDKNVYGNIYHVREPETRRLEMRFGDFVDCFHTWDSERVALLAKIQCGPSAALDTEQDAYAADYHAASDLCQKTDDLKEHIAWDWLTNLRKRCFLGDYQHSTLQVLGKDSLLPLQFCTSDRIVAQIRGRQRLLLVPPSQALHGLYPFPVHHMYDTYSMLDTEDVDTDMWPNADKVKGMQCVLRPGEILFIPQYWSVAFQGVEQENISLEFLFGPRVCPRDAVELQVSRVVEERVVELEGLDDAKHWLGIIARGEELQWIDLSSLRGYRRIKMVQDIRDHVEQNCGRGACEAFLTALCESRLNPTTWLNKNFREPLYLLDKPVWHMDDRTEDEKKYPELFRRRLEGRGWSVPQAASTLRIPGYNT